MTYARLALGLALAATAATPALARPRYAATITRTAYGIPHIVARDMAGLGYGVGYSAAEDNGCVIAEALVTARGERSRAFGKSGSVTVGTDTISNLDSDLYHRAIGDLPRLRAARAAATADYQALLSGFAAGYNRFLKANRARLAADCRDADWLRPIDPDDMSLLINSSMTLASSAGLARQIAAAQPPAATPAAAIGLPQPLNREALGSNGWAFGSQSTVNGRGLLVGNPHFPWSGPNRFRRMHLTIPGKLDVMGAGLILSPFVAIGFNRDVAWTHTVTTAQHATLFELALDPADPTAYLVDGKRVAMIRREVTIEVKGEPPIRRSLWSSAHGPLVAMPAAGLGWSATRAYALKDADQANFRAGAAWLGIARARSVHQVLAAIGTTLGVPYVNTIAADRHGEALYADVTAVPNVSAAHLFKCGAAAGRAAPGLAVLDGARAACDWLQGPPGTPPGLLPATEQASLIRRDWVQNSNDSFWLANPNARFPQLAPLLGQTGIRQNFRTRSGIKEIRALLAARKVDAPAAAAMALANKVHTAELFLDDLLALCPARADLAEACAALAGWDRRADLESRGALLWFAFWRRVGAVPPPLFATPFDSARPLETPAGLNRDRAKELLDALAAAAAELKALKVALDAPLGSVQVSPRGDARIPIHGGPGGAGVLNAITSIPDFKGGGLMPVYGSSYMQVVTFDATGPVADTMLSYSQSTDPASPNYADGTRAFSEKRWHRMPFTPAAIARARIGRPLAIAE